MGIFGDLLGEGFRQITGAKSPSRRGENSANGVSGDGINDLKNCKFDYNDREKIYKEMKKQIYIPGSANFETNKKNLEEFCRIMGVNDIDPALKFYYKSTYEHFFIHYFEQIHSDYIKKRFREITSRLINSGEIKPKS